VQLSILSGLLGSSNVRKLNTAQAGARGRRLCCNLMCCQSTVWIKPRLQFHYFVAFFVSERSYYQNLLIPLTWRCHGFYDVVAVLLTSLRHFPRNGGAKRFFQWLSWCFSIILSRTLQYNKFVIRFFLRVYMPINSRLRKWCHPRLRLEMTSHSQPGINSHAARDDITFSAG